MTNRFRPYIFAPMAHLHEDADIVELTNRFNQQGVLPVFQLCAWRRRVTWATTVPIGVFINDFRPNAVTLEEHEAAREQLYTTARAAERAENPRFRPHDPIYAATIRDGQVFYTIEALRFLRMQVPHPAFLNALYAFLLDVKNDPSLVVVKQSQRPYIAPDQRKHVFNLKGSMCRGPAWTPEEDAVLRRWFGMRADKHHASLTPTQWTHVLNVELKGRRTKQSTQNRFVILNDKLLSEYLVDGVHGPDGKMHGGYVPLNRLPEYMSRAIGERPRLPPLRPKRRAL